MSDTETIRPKVLLIEDEADVRDLLRLHLRRAGCDVFEAEDGPSGLQAVSEISPDLVVLDLMLPGLPGEEICRRLKSTKATADLPVVMLTAKAQTDDRVAGLEIGADDYLVKPFSPRELVLRIEAVLRRTNRRVAEENLTVGPFVLDRLDLEVRMDGAKLDLTALEFRLMVKLMENHGRALSREFLLREVWGYQQMTNTRTVDTHVRRLRSKLRPHQGHLATVHGEGYRLHVPASL